MLTTAGEYKAVLHIAFCQVAGAANFVALVSEGQQVVVGEKIIELAAPTATQLLAAVSVVIPGVSKLEETPAEEVTAGEDTVLQFKKA